MDDLGKTQAQLVAELQALREECAALRASERRFRTLFEQSPLSIQIFRHDGICLEANQAWAALWDADPEQLEGLNILTDQQLAEKGTLPLIERAFAGESVSIPPTPYDPAEIGKQGRQRWVQAFAFPVKDEQGQTREVGLILQDVTGQRIVEAELRSSEERYRQLVEFSPTAIAVHQRGILVYANPAAAALIGADAPERLIGMPLLGFVHPDYRPLVLERARRTQEQGAAAALVEEKFVRLDGQVIDVEVVAIPTRHEGLPASQVVVRDITERKRAERALHLLAELSSALTARLDYQATLQSLARFVVPELADWCLVDLVQEDWTVNRVAVACVNPDDEVLAYQLQRAYAPRPDAPHGVSHVARTGQSELVVEISDEVLQTLARDEDHLRMLRALGMCSYISVPLIARGQTLGVMTLIMATHERRYVAEDLALAEELARRAATLVDNARLYHETQQALTIRGQFLSLAAHELKTPMTTIMASAQLMQRQLARDPNAAERDIMRVRTLVDQIQRLNRLISSLLDLSRIQEGRLTIDREPLDLCAVLRQLVDELTPTLQVHELQVELPDMPCTIQGDRLRLEQVFQNLLQNALKYSPHGGRIRLALAQVDGQARCEVQDEGVGIPARDLPHIFERFHRGTNVDVRRLSGMGIGLYVVQEIVVQHEGGIEVCSAEGEGSTFIVTLPLA